MWTRGSPTCPQPPTTRDATMNLNPVPELAPQLKQLRLSGILDSLEARNRQPIGSKLAYTEFLALLIGDEVARREQKKFSLHCARRRGRFGCCRHHRRAGYVGHSVGIGDKIS